MAETSGQSELNAQPGTPGLTAPAPGISLPKGGGAIRSIAEKFAANPATGTGSISVPLAASTGRSGFSPQLSLSYDSGAGNGPFGLGWQLVLPAITRRTDSGLPKYQDSSESDVFVLSGSEDLVPELKQTGNSWVRPDPERRVMNGTPYTVRRYRPRVEGLFARIERWTELADAAHTFWRSISRDNVTTWYGKTDESRIADPHDGTRIFQWLICESYDDKGNVIAYGYKGEDSDNVETSQAHERNRNDASRSANRYIKRVRYGNRTPHLPDLGASNPVSLPTDWCFELVFDYGDHHPTVPLPDEPGKKWPCRADPFSSRRAGFEVRTYRICRRALMFHHFAGRQGVGNNCLVRSTDLTYTSHVQPTDPRNPIYSFLLAIAQTGYRRRGTGYLSRSLPPLEFGYTEPVIDPTVRDVDLDSLANAPEGIDGVRYQFVDLYGDGISGILTEQTGGWTYKPNLSPSTLGDNGGAQRPSARFGPGQLVDSMPSLANLSSGTQQLLDVSGDGQVDLVDFQSATPGFFGRTPSGGWEPFRAFDALPVLDWSDPQVRFIDLTGDGRADVLITEDQALCWYPSQAEAGFGAAERVLQQFDEERGPRVAFADSSEAIFLADLSGDGLTDIARVRDGDVCYWPNLGYGRFGSRVSMDAPPSFESPGLFDATRVRLADIDGSGTTDIIYFGTDGVHAVFNESGNGWTADRKLDLVPQADGSSSMAVHDLLGNGTACLVWSSPLPASPGRSMRYLDMMGGTKPHLLTTVRDSLGAETRIDYSPSTKFSLADRLAGNPWVTKLPFPVHVVERVVTRDYVSRSRFVTRYAYHHGFYDGVEREFRGFGLVEQWDTELLAALGDNDEFPEATNVDTATHVPAVRTKTWFHTGIYLGRDRVSRLFARLGDPGALSEYYREPGLNDEQASRRLLDDTVLDDGWTVEQEREACRALKGSMLRQEVYALDGSGSQGHPYTVTEQNFRVVRTQPIAANRNGVFLPTSREALTYSYERNPVDPRVSHALTLQVDAFGNTLRSLSVGYGRRGGNSSLTGVDLAQQTTALVTYTENDFTNEVDEPDSVRTPRTATIRTYELSGFALTDDTARPAFDAWVDGNFGLLSSAVQIPYERDANPLRKEKRLIEHVRTRYRSDDMKTLLAQKALEALALPGETYKLAFTPGLLSEVYRRTLPGQPPEDLLPDRLSVLFTAGGDRGGYVDLDGDGHAWVPSGRVFFWPGVNPANPALTAPQEGVEARAHFYQPRKWVDPFGQITTTAYDADDLLVESTLDAIGNGMSAEHDYRVLQPARVTDPNGNATEAAFDALGLVAATAVRGKAGQDPGDTVAGVVTDPTTAEIVGFFDTVNPHTLSAGLLKTATTRTVYDIDRFRRTRQANPGDSSKWEPVVAATLARETHVADPTPPGGLRVQVSFGYFDGFGRDIQKKVQAEPGPVVAGGPVVTPRWVGSGWTISNNKGLPVRQYEPFFSATHRFEFAKQVGVSSVLFYDPVGRVVATIHPDDSYQKVRFDSWLSAMYDVTDTSTSDPRTDPDIAGYVHEYLALHPAFSTWAAQRQGGAKGPFEKDAADKTTFHGDTPGVIHGDTLGRPFLTVAHNRFMRAAVSVDEKYATRVALDIEGNRRHVRDASTTVGNPLGRIAVRYRYDMIGNRVYQASIDAGERWVLGDVSGRPIRAWNSRKYRFAYEYDALRRQVQSSVQGGDAADPNSRLFPTAMIFERIVHGETSETGLTAAQQRAANLRGQVARQFDGAGSVTSDRYDVKGNMLRTTRRFTQDYIDPPDWAGAVTLESESFTATMTFDALNRVTSAVSPDDSTYRPTYNDAGLLDQVHVNLRGSLVGGAPAWTSFVTDIHYDARGQRTRIEYQNGAVTTSDYDPITFRLAHLRTTRPPSQNGLSAHLFKSPTVVQDLRYTYDAAGSITRISDDALRTIFHGGEQVEPVCIYTYDAVGRLVESAGREHVGQSALRKAGNSRSHRDHPFVGADHANDWQAMRHYAERFEYDPVGNLQRLAHTATDGHWSRTYQYDARGNRLAGSIIGPGAAIPVVETYQHDAHGNMTKMPHLATMRWDANDRLTATSRQVVNQTPPPAATPEMTYYVYDSAGERVRKVSEGPAGARRSERLYLSGVEIYREYGAGRARLTRETLHVMDDRQRVALVETKTMQGGQEVHGPVPAVRFQLGSHLESASLELDEQAAVITYEEFSAYGNTTYQAGRSAAEVGLKRYRYTGKERDEESGFNHHGARYYAPWIGRWTACDPVDKHPLSSYEYCGGRPTGFSDPTGQDDDPVRGVSFSGQGDSGGVSRHAPYQPPKPGGMSAGYSPKPKAPPSQSLSSSAKTPAPPTYWEQQIAQMEEQAKQPGWEQGYYDYSMEVTKDDRRAASLARKYPALAPSIEGKQHQEWFLKVAPFAIPGAPGARLATAEIRAAVGEVSTGARAADAIASKVLTVEEMSPAATPVVGRSSSAPYAVTTQGGRPTVSFGEGAPTFGYKPGATPPALSPSAIRPGPGIKAVAGTPGGPLVMSGVDETAVGVYQYRLSTGQAQLSHFRDIHKTTGTYYSAHAEAKAFFLNPTASSVTVSKPPCIGCIEGFKGESALLDRTIEIHAPTTAGAGTWVFRNGGSWVFPFGAGF